MDDGLAMVRGLSVFFRMLCGQQNPIPRMWGGRNRAAGTSIGSHDMFGCEFRGHIVHDSKNDCPPFRAEAAKHSGLKSPAVPT